MTYLVNRSFTPNVEDKNSKKLSISKGLSIRNQVECVLNIYRYIYKLAPEKKKHLALLRMRYLASINIGRIMLTKQVGWLVVLRFNVPVNNFSVMSGRY